MLRGLAAARPAPAGFVASVSEPRGAASATSAAPPRRSLCPTGEGAGEIRSPAPLLRPPWRGGAYLKATVTVWVVPSSRVTVSDWHMPESELSLW